MNKEEFLKAIENVPKTDSINTISAYNSINVEDLANAVERFKKIPTYDELLKENKILKENYERIYNENCILREKHNINDIGLLDENYKLKQIIDKATNELFILKDMIYKPETREENFEIQRKISSIIKRLNGKEVE